MQLKSAVPAHNVPNEEGRHRHRWLLWFTILQPFCTGTLLPSNYPSYIYFCNFFFFFSFCFCFVYSMPNPLAYVMAFNNLSLSFSLLEYSGSKRTLKQVWDVGNLNKEKGKNRKIIKSLEICSVLNAPIRCISC